jgi:hypothetical protein
MLGTLPVSTASSRGILVLADAAVPMISGEFFGMVLLLVPIILVESVLCKKWLRIGLAESLKANSLSNAASTLLGVPLSWLLAFLVTPLLAKLDPSVFRGGHVHGPIGYFVASVASAAWASPVMMENRFVVPLALVVLFVPAFFISWLVEYLIVNYLEGIAEDPSLAENPRSRRRICAAVRNANLVSYGLIFGSLTTWFLVRTF